MSDNYDMKRGPIPADETKITKALVEEQAKEIERLRAENEQLASKCRQLAEQAAVLGEMTIELEKRHDDGVAERDKVIAAMRGLVEQLEGDRQDRPLHDEILALTPDDKDIKNG